MRSIHPDDLVEVLVAGLDESNCVDVLNHEVLRKYPEFEAGDLDDALEASPGSHLQVHGRALPVDGEEPKGKFVEGATSPLDPGA